MGRRCFELLNPDITVDNIVQTISLGLDTPSHSKMCLCKNTGPMAVASAYVYKHILCVYMYICTHVQNGFSGNNS